MQRQYEYLSHDDVEDIKELLLGRRIVEAHVTPVSVVPGFSWKREGGDGYLVLDNGTKIYVSPNIGGCSCGAGDYELTHLATVDNIITDVRVINDPDGDDYYDRSGGEHEGYQIFVVADAQEINVLQIDGSDGNGYYGTGYTLTVVSCEPEESSLS